MQTVKTSKLRRIREALEATREDVFRRTKTVTLRTIQNAEENKRIRRTSAREILDALNILLAEANKPALTLEELELSLY